MNSWPRILPHILSRILALLGLAMLLVLAPARSAQAFCGFYVAGADASLYNDATMVVLMRDGTRTVLSMQNSYRGPVEDFAMVVPVPVVLKKSNVRVLDAELFEKVDRLASPRLVEYWESDPCPAEQPVHLAGSVSYYKMYELDDGVRVEARFTVGEYEIAVLSAKHSTGLESWLERNDYNIPTDAEPLLRPYVQAGMKFFVAKIDVDKVHFDAQGRARLSPLRIHYDSPEFSLPIRLGLINAAGERQQDLIVHILGRKVRYEVANYDNVAIPTNLDVTPETREHFGEFYAALFDHTLAKHPGAVITEYAWQASKCDPCPTTSSGSPTLTLLDLVTLGADVLPSYESHKPSEIDFENAMKPLAERPPRPSGRSYPPSLPEDFVLTRLHARYDKDSLGEDLVFQAAPGIRGGIEHMGPSDGVTQTHRNQFQARYAIRHPWPEPITCAHPQRSRWGGPWSWLAADEARRETNVALGSTLVSRDASLTEFLSEESKQLVEETVGVLPEGPIAEPRPLNQRQAGCRYCAVEHSGGEPLALVIGLLMLFGLRRRR